MTEIKRIPLEGLFNTRDLGGLPTKDGRHIRPFRLLRSGALRNMTPSDKDTLLGTYHLRTIVDFRTVNEQAESPDPVLSGVTHISNPILEEMTAGITHDKDSDRKLTLEEATLTMKERGVDPSEYMAEMYREIISSDFAMGQYRKFFDTLCDNDEGATLWHCSAGKDRVGIGTALLLYVLGVDIQIIFQDYMMTGIFLKDEIDAMLSRIPRGIVSDDALENIRTCMGVKEVYLENVFAYMKNCSGSIEEFLSSKMGLTEDKTQRLKTLYLT